MRKVPEKIRNRNETINLACPWKLMRSQDIYCINNKCMAWEDIGNDNGYCKLIEK